MDGRVTADRPTPDGIEKLVADQGNAEPVEALPTTPGAAQPTDSAAEPSERTRARLEYVCTHHTELSAELIHIAGAEQDESVLLRSLAVALAEDQPCEPALEAIHQALIEANDQLGLDGRIDPEPRGPHPVGVDPARPPATDETVYVCPKARCPRYAFHPAGASERCDIAHLPLRKDRL
ncbi:hypothetical protein [Catenulispora rubra]|uniref:hypothetical protein n=1 Tax=Catenulispora rubra TaxID=280293 RepID=UPI001891F707|nr:hypothetical protein [Catenulispora rubra]